MCSLLADIDCKIVISDTLYGIVFKMFTNRYVWSCVLVLLCIGQSTPKIAPDFIRPCPPKDPECLKKVIQEAIPLFTQGIPSLGINTSDPARQNKSEMELPGGLKVQFRDGTVTGFKKCLVDSVTYNKDLEADINMHCNLTIKGKYSAVGSILIVTINGDGDAKIKIPNIGLKMRLSFEDITEDGVVYRILKNMKVTTSYDGRVSFVFTNLFKGNPELSEAVLTFMNENWKKLVEDLGKPIEDIIINTTSKLIKKFFASVPRDELFSL